VDNHRVSSDGLGLRVPYDRVSCDGLGLQYDRVVTALDDDTANTFAIAKRDIAKSLLDVSSDNYLSQALDWTTCPLLPPWLAKTNESSQILKRL
jgi:hypothetical protein